MWFNAAGICIIGPTALAGRLRALGGRDDHCPWSRGRPVSRTFGGPMDAPSSFMRVASSSDLSRGGALGCMAIRPMLVFGQRPGAWCGGTRETGFFIAP